MKKFVKDYMENLPKLSKAAWVGVIAGILVLAGIFGFVYETIFYQFNNGGFTRRGTGFGPWVQLYAFGGVAIFAGCLKIRKKPWLVVLVSGLVAGVLEYVVGWAMLEFGGIRGWDYNTEILNWGNINGFICFRSVAFFAVSGLLLMYVIAPFLIWLSQRLKLRTFVTITVLFAALFLADFVYNDLLADNLGWPNALSFWESTGIYDFVPYHKTV